MRGFLRAGLVVIGIVTVTGLTLRATGLSERLGDQFRRPTGFAGRIAAWTMPRMFWWLYTIFAKILDLQPEDEVLDIACGSGVFLRKHASHVRRIAGLDHSEIQIELAVRENRDRVAAGTAEFVVGDATDLPWADGSFSVATSNCLDCFEGKARPALEEMYRVLRSGGRAVVGDDHREAMEAAGFDRVSLERVLWATLTTGYKD
jgi:SAM-dependent methyltransferase